MDNEQFEKLLGRLDVVVATLQLANADSIAAARAQLLGDPAYAVILDRTTDWVQAGELKKTVMEQASVSKATAERRIAELCGRGFLRQDGGGTSTRYRSTGVI
jgi:hypothetical protein